MYIQKILLTLGPLWTCTTVKDAMLKDSDIHDYEYGNMITKLQDDLSKLVGVDKSEYSVVFLQGSGANGVESIVNMISCSTFIKVR